MPRFRAFDGTEFGYQVFGDGIPVICLPGGPMQDSDYLGRLALITPSTRAVGIETSEESRLATARHRRGEPWFPAAFAALEEVVAGNATEDSRQAIAPFFYGRWDAAAQAHHAAQDGHRNEEAAAAFGAEGAFDMVATRALLATFDAPVLLLGGEEDLNTVPSVVAEFAALFPNAEMVVQRAAGHFPWLDDADRFVATMSTFLG